MRDKKAMSGTIKALILALIVLVSLSWAWNRFSIPSFKIIGGHEKKVNETSEYLYKFWEELTEEEQKQLPISLQADKKLEQAESYLNDGRNNNDKDKLSKAKNLAQEVLQMQGISDKHKQRAEGIIKAVDDALKSSVAKQLYLSAKDNFQSGDNEDAVSKLNDCISKYGNTADGARCFALFFVKKENINAENLRDNINKFLSDELKKAPGDNNKKAQLYYTAGAIYEEAASVFNNNSFLQDALKYYDMAYNTAPRHLAFSISAQLRRGIIYEDKIGGTEGKSKALGFYKKILDDYGADSRNDISVQEARNRLFVAAKEGYLDTISIVTSLTGFVEDGDMLSYDEQGKFENIPPDKDLSRITLSSLGSDYELDIQFKVSFKDVKKDSGFDKIYEIVEEEPLWLLVQVKEPYGGTVLCQKVNDQEKRIRLNDIKERRAVLTCDNYVTFRGVSIETSQGWLFVKMKVIFNYFMNNKDKIVTVT